MKYSATVVWHRHSEPFTVKTYDRTHHIHFGGGFSVEASSAPEYLGKAELPNPEELFVASISSCFMLTFLYWAATKGFIVNEYHAKAEGTLGKNSEAKMAMTEVIITPKVSFSEKIPDPDALKELFDKAHENCFISSSVKTKISIAYGASVNA
ncbi:MAG: OsmC family protein [Gammaproteobacteria bacterium]|nr:OsmC family protein [Gammaproteobacteria bacterium]